MATATKGMKTKAKAKVKVKANVIPKFASEEILNTRLPLSTEAMGRLAAALTAFEEKVVTWKAACKKHYADGGKLSDLPAQPTMPDPNKGAMSQTSYEKLLDRIADGESGVHDIAWYNPVRTDMARRLHCGFLRKSNDQKKAPSNWDTNLWGNWKHEDTDGEFSIPSGLIADTVSPRLQHATSVERLVVDPKKNILTLGSNRFVVGDNTLKGCAAMLLRPQTGGNYLAGDLARRRMSIAGNVDALAVVFKVEDKANNGGGVTIKGNWTPHVNEIVFMPGQALTPGFLHDAKGKRLDAKAIRASDGKGLKFKPLTTPIVCKAIPWDRLWKEIQVIGKESISDMRKRDGRSEEYEKGSPQENSKTNLGTTRRVAPTGPNCFGFRAAQCGVVPYYITEDDAQGVVIGSRGTHPYDVKKPKKVVAPKAAKKATSKKTTSDAAPPIVADTADTPSKKTAAAVTA